MRSECSSTPATDKEQSSASPVVAQHASPTFPTLDVGALQAVFLHMTVVAEAKFDRHRHAGDVELKAN
jgi:hypothetical protein